MFRLPEATGGSFPGLPPAARRIALDPTNDVAWRTIDQMIPYELRRKSVSQDDWYLPAGTRPGQFDDAD